MTSKILLLSILVLSFNEMTAKPFANKMQPADSYQNDHLSNTVHRSKFTHYLKEISSNKQSPQQLQRNVWFKNDKNEENETNEINGKFKDINEIKYIETEKNDGGVDEETCSVETDKSPAETSSGSQTLSPAGALPSQEDKGYRTESADVRLRDDATSQDNFQEEALTEHNYYRRWHDAPALTLNKTMSESAANYAKRLVLLGSMDHSNQRERPNQGENLFMECSKSNLPKPNDSTKKWYGEVCDYDFQESKSNLGKVTGHFTQLVWKPTKEFGIGYATGVNKNYPGMKCVYVVARYKPAGNVLGQFSSTVGRRLSDESNNCSRKGTEMPTEPEEQSDTDTHGMSPEQSDDDDMNVPIDTTGEMLQAPVEGIASPSRHADGNAADVRTEQESIVAPLTTDFGEISAYVSSVEDVATIPNKVNRVTTPSRQGTSLVVGSPPGLNGVQAVPVTSTVAATSTNLVASPSPPVAIPAPGTSGASVVSLISPASTGNPAVSIKPETEETLKEFQLAMLKEHNSLRIRHGSKLLDLDANLNSDAASDARQLAQKPPVKGAYRLLPSGIGQNTYSQCGKSLSGAGVTNGWYNEICKTGFVNPVVLTQRAAQFIQVVWKETISIGVSFALGMDSRGKILCTHVVVLYKPGAIHHLKNIEENVKPGSFDAKVHCRQLSNQGGSIAQQRVVQQPVTATQPNVAQQGPTVASPNVAHQPVTTAQPNVAKQSTTGTPNAAQQPVTTTQPNVAQQGATVSSPNVAQQPVAETQPNVAQQGTKVTPNAVQQPVQATSPNVAQQAPTVTSPDVAQQPVTATQPNVAQQGATGTPNAAQQLTKETSPNVAKQSVKATSPNVVQTTTVTPANAAQQGVAATLASVAQAPVPSATPQNQGSPIVNAVAASSSGANSVVSHQRTPVSVPTASQTEDDFEKKALQQHNIFRKRHGAESLTLDRQLCNEAKEYAKKLSQRGPDKEPQHSQQAGRINEGENLFVGCNANIDSADITRIWYNEVCHYDFITYQATGAAPVGHFTQIVWKASKKFGIAREFRGDSQIGCVYVVARYSPKKTISQVVDNIDKGRFSPSVCRVESKTGKGAILTQSTGMYVTTTLP